MEVANYELNREEKAKIHLGSVIGDNVGPKRAAPNVFLALLLDLICYVSQDQQSQIHKPKSDCFSVGSSSGTTHLGQFRSSHGLTGGFLDHAPKARALDSTAYIANLVAPWKKKRYPWGDAGMGVNTTERSTDRSD